MLLPGEEEDVLDDDIIEDDDIKEDDLEIDLDADDEDDDDDEEAKREEKSRNKAFAAMRNENKALKDSVDSLTTQVSNINRPAAPVQQQVPGMPRTDDEWDDLAEKDWKKAVDLRSILNAQNIVKQQQKSTKAESTLEDSKQRVLELHPEVDTNNSEKAKIFENILRENPDYLQHPKGPLYAMRDMEDYMETTLGYKRSDIRAAEKKGAARETSRQNRIVLNKGSGRIGSKTGNKIVLSKDDMDFCKFQGIDPKEFARNKKKLSKSTTEEVST